MRIVVFDLGGVVVRICRSWKEACARTGVPFHDLAASAENMAARKAIVRRHEVGEVSDEAYFEAIAATTGGLYRAADVRVLHDNWITGEYAGVDRLIDDLHASGVETGILSNTNNHHWQQMTAPVSGGDGRSKFPTVQRARFPHASHLLKVAKPEAAIFEAFCRATGFGHHDVVFFDDLADNVAGARSSGWDAVQIDHTGDTASQMRLHLRLRGVEV